MKPTCINCFLKVKEIFLQIAEPALEFPKPDKSHALVRYSFGRLRQSRLRRDAACALGTCDQPDNEADDRENQNAQGPQKLRTGAGTALKGFYDRIDIGDEHQQSDYTIFHGFSPLYTVQLTIVRRFGSVEFAVF
tara:strand:+ start:1068 stop:1472 length:405 start_codon:yes stop_codon:yes gene_type:complete